MATKPVTTSDTYDHCTGSREGTGRERKVAKSAWRNDIFNPDTPDPAYRRLVGERRAAVEAATKATRACEDYVTRKMTEAGLLPAKGWRHASDTDKPAEIEVLFAHRFGFMGGVAIVPVDHDQAARKSNVSGKFAIG